jgi:hypothetical protein
MRLNEDNALVGVNAGRQPVKHHFVDIFPQGFCAFQSGESMNIYYTIDAVIFILKDNEILYRSQVVTNMLSACGAEARENAFSHLFVPKFNTQEKQVTRLKEIS